MMNSYLAITLHLMPDQETASDLSGSWACVTYPSADTTVIRNLTLG